MLDVLSIIAPLFVLLGVGIVAGFSKRFRDAQSGLNAFVFNFSLPAFIFVAVAGAPISDGLPLAFIWLTLGGTAAVYFVVYFAAVVRWKFSKSRKNMVLPGPLGIASTYGNVGYLGVPIVMSVFGADAALAAALGQLLHNVLFMVGYPLLKSFDGGQRDRSEGHGKAMSGTLWRVFKRSILLSPIMVSVVAGVLVSLLGAQVPEMLTTSIEMFGDAAVPVAMFAVGLTVKPAFDGVFSGGVPIGAVLLSSAVKLLVLPLATLGLALLIGGDLTPIWIAAAVVMAAMPVSSTASIVVFEYDGDVRLVAAVTLVTSLGAILTIPLMITLLP